MGGSLVVLKIILFVGALFDVLIGIGCFILAKFTNDLDSRLLTMDSVKDMQPKVVIAIAVLGGVTIVTGLLGFLGFFKKIKCLQIQFLTMNFLYFLAFGAVFAANLYGKSYIDEQLPSDACTTGSLSSSNDLFTNAQAIWCETVSTTNGAVAGCPCNITDPSKWSASQQITLGTKSGVNGLGTTNLQSCTNFQTYYGSSTTEIQFLEVIEELFSCTGVCTGDIIYYFSNINNGPPGNTTQGCYQSVRDKIFEWLAAAYIYSVIASAFSIVTVIFTIAFLCVGNKEDKKSPKVESQQDTAKA